MLIKKDGQILDRTVEKIYTINSRRKTRDGEEYIYKNYEVFIPYEYLEFMGIEDHMYVYIDGMDAYLTSQQPDGSVPAKKLSVHKQRGSTKSRKYKPEETRNNRWKRFFIVPKKFFPYVSEDKAVVFTLDPNNDDKFCDAGCRLKMELVDKD